MIHIKSIKTKLIQITLRHNLEILAVFCLCHTKLIGITDNSYSFPILEGDFDILLMFGDIHVFCNMSHNVFMTFSLSLLVILLPEYDKLRKALSDQ